MVKYLNDNVDAQMFDIISAGKQFDLGVILSNSTNNLSWASRTVMIDSGSSFASYYASIEATAKTKLASVASTLKELSEKLHN